MPTYFSNKNKNIEKNGKKNCNLKKEQIII